MPTSRQRRVTDSAPDELIADAIAVVPALRAVLEKEANRRRLRGVGRAEWIAAVSVLLGSGLLNEHLAREAAIEHERAFEGSAAAAHAALGAAVGITRQGAEHTYGLTGERGRELRARLT
ncbi:hypothetical protein [Microbacterium laevaniformans]|uniref:hypothetical protein n=1 Tax=Microbacterium laevaniformans TaxID=36807 RepID=UPI003D992F7F